jgi:hypothetical protein
MSTTYLNAQSSNGTCVLTIPAATGVCWNLTFLEVSLSGSGYAGPGATLTIYDGAVGGAVLYKCFLALPVGSVGTVQKVNLPEDGAGPQHKGVQTLPGNAMNVVVAGVGSNLISINARVSDGIPAP